MRPFTNNDWNTLPHITVTSPKDWNPASLDSTIPEEWYQKQNHEPELLCQGILMELGDLKPDLKDNVKMMTKSTRIITQLTGRASRCFFPN